MPHRLCLLCKVTPTCENLTKPKMTTTAGHMVTRWDWLIKVQTAPRRPQATRMDPPRTISWEVILGALNSLDKMGTFR
jgi:hypothetical protein